MNSSRRNSHPLRGTLNEMAANERERERLQKRWSAASWLCVIVINTQLGSLWLEYKFYSIRLTVIALSRFSRAHFAWFCARSSYSYEEEWNILQNDAMMLYDAEFLIYTHFFPPFIFVHWYWYCDIALSTELAVRKFSLLLLLLIAIRLGVPLNAEASVSEPRLRWIFGTPHTLDQCGSWILLPHLCAFFFLQNCFHFTSVFKWVWSSIIQNQSHGLKWKH